MSRSMLPLCAVVGLALGCGSKPARTTGPDPRATPTETRTEIEIRRDKACEALGPRITACSIEDARRTMTAAELAKLDLDKTAPVHTAEFIAACQRQQLSSRQVRVYEVCSVEETECEPLLACLDNAAPTAAEGGAASAP